MLTAKPGSLAGLFPLEPGAFHQAAATTPCNVLTGSGWGRWLCSLRRPAQAPVRSAHGGFTQSHGAVMDQSPNREAAVCRANTDASQRAKGFRLCGRWRKLVAL